MSLETLPSELQSKICSYLVKSFGPLSTHALLRTSKQLYDVALPLSVQIFRNTTPMHVGGGPCSETRNLQFLRYILITKPELAKKVDTVILGSFAATKDNDTQLGGMTKDDLDICERFIIYTLGPGLNEHESRRRDEWIAHLKEGSSDAQVALLLLACSDLKRLYFEDGQRTPLGDLISGKPPCFEFLLEVAKTISTSNMNTPGFKPPLSKLQHIQVQSHEGNSNSLAHTFRLMALPQLKIYESLDTTNHDHSSMDSMPPLSEIVAPGTSSVEEILLHQSHASASEVTALSASCRHLKIFEYISATYEPISGISARDILEAVLPHANTLHSLHLNLFDESEKVNWNSNLSRLYMGTELAQLKSLKHLHIGMQSLTGMFEVGPYEEYAMPPEIKGAPKIIDCIPENLTELLIRDCGKAILEQATELLSMIEGGKRFKDLRHVVLIFKDEKIEPEEIHLRLSSPGKHLTVLFQTLSMRRVDSGGGRNFPGTRNIPSVCSRIFADDLRHDWIDFRGRITTKRYENGGGGGDFELPYTRVDAHMRVRRLLFSKPPDEFRLDD